MSSTLPDGTEQSCPIAIAEASKVGNQTELEIQKFRDDFENLKTQVVEQIGLTQRYSTDETDLGEIWFGQNAFKKTFQVSPAILENAVENDATEIKITHTIANFSRQFGWEVIALHSEGFSLSSSYTSSTGYHTTDVTTNPTDIMMNCDDIKSLSDVYITIWYVKTV